jgi:aspartyl/asparaginyl beta-hydroxylase
MAEPNAFGNVGPLTPKKLAVLASLAASGRTPVVKPEHVREICKVDIAELERRVRAVPEAQWRAEDEKKENAFTVFDQTQHIVARFNTGTRGPESWHATGTWADWQDLLLPLMQGIAGHYGLAQPDFPKVMFARLAAGGRIAPHSDLGVPNHLAHKIHVPIVTNDKVMFRVGNKRFHLSAGSAYELNNIAVHSVKNGGDEDRIHLVFELFDAALTPAPPAPR